MAIKTVPIISVTGTKGKTTVVNVISTILRAAGQNTLHVDTSGHFVNGERRSVAADTLRIWGVRTVTALPGKYLGDFLHDPVLQDKPAAVLECSFSCATHGLGYGSHKVGVFLNVFEDHVDPRGAIKTREDLARAKSFVFSAIGDDGYAVFNADDELVCRMLERIPADNRVKLIPCGVSFQYFDLAKHLAKGGAAIALESGEIVLKAGNARTVMADVRQVPWTFDGAFAPSVINLLHVCGALYGFYDGKLPKEVRTYIEDTRLNPETGRLVLLKAENGATIIGDYAHEKVSLRALATLARTKVQHGGKLIGIVRLAHERTDAVLHETAHVIAESFDEVIVYDKIDGHWRSPGEPYIERYPQVVGRTSEIVAQAAATKNSHTTRIIREDEAVERAASIAGPDDVVVVILNDDVQRSLKFIQESFKAEYL